MKITNISVSQQVGRLHARWVNGSPGLHVVYLVVSESLQGPDKY